MEKQPKKYMICIIREKRENRIRNNLRFLGTKGHQFLDRESQQSARMGMTPDLHQGTPETEKDFADFQRKTKNN